MYIIAATVVVAVLIGTNEELPQIVAALKNLAPIWIWACAALMVIYLVLRSITLIYALHVQNERITALDAIIVTGVGQFYSAITPSASGGQPMQVLALHKMGVSAASATAALSMKYLGFQSAFSLLGILAWILNKALVDAQLYGFRWLVVFGIFINVLLGVLLLLMSVNVALVERIVRAFIGLGGRLRLIKDVERTHGKVMGYIRDYRSALNHFNSRPFSAIMVLILSIAQVLAFTGVVFCLYKAFGLDGFSYWQLTALQILLFLSASFMPLPGASGAQEGGFFVFFKGVFPSGSIIAAMLCWRLFTYYFLMLSGLAAVVLNRIREMNHQRRCGKRDD